MRQRDLRLLISHGSFVHHRAHASFVANDVDWRTTQEDNRVRFEEKWGLDTRHRPVMLSACLIVKDEEVMLPACLESLRDVVDEIVVYDTGSSDGTLEIAREAGAKVVEGEWVDSFATARNAALGLASGEWVLSIDADERLQTDPSLLRAQLADPRSEVEAYLVAIENLHGPGNPRSVHTAIRVFLRRSASWRHRLHEQVVAADDPARRLRTAYLSGARLIHHGYIAEVFEDRNKVERNLQLARAALDDGEVQRSYALMNFGRALESAGRSDEAVVCLSEAAATAADTITRRLALTNLVYILGRIGRFDEALSRLSELRQLSRSQVAADIAEGRTRLAMGQTVEGLAILARIPSRARDDDGMEYGPHVVAAICGEALASLGRFGEAADVVLKAVRSEGVLEADLAELMRWLLRAGRSPAEITASLRAEDLVPMLGRVLRQPPPVADVLLDGAWAHFPDRLEPLAAAARVAPELPLARALVWSARLRQRGLATSCPLVVICQNQAIDPVVRVRAAAALHGSFGDARALDMAHTALGELNPGARRASEEEVDRLAPGLLSALVGTPPVAVSAAAAPPPGAVGADAAAPTAPVSRNGGSATPTRGRGRIRVLDVAPTTRRGGLNIVGPFEGTSVEADMARRLAAALRERGVPLSTTSYHRDDRDLGSPWSHRGRSDFPFGVNLLFVHPDQLTDFVLDSGPGMFHDRYTIGMWIWDLELPSAGMADATHMVHEVWTPTAWGAGVASSVHGGPVHCVPAPVGGRPRRPDHATIGLPDGFVFASSIDYDDGFMRQNPLGRRRGVCGGLLARRRPPPCHSCHPRRSVSGRARTARRGVRRTSGCRGPATRPRVRLRPRQPDCVVRLLHLPPPGRRRPGRSGQGDVMGHLHHCDGDIGDARVPDRTRQWPRTLSAGARPRRRVPLPPRRHLGRPRSWSTPVPSCVQRWPIRGPRRPRSSAARQVAARRFSRSVATAVVRARLADIDALLRPGRPARGGVPSRVPHAADPPLTDRRCR